MKLLIVLVAVLGVSTAATLPAGKALDRHTRSLSDDWADFVDLVPVDEIREILVIYLAEDAEVQAVAAWLRSSEFKEILERLWATEEVINFGAFLRDAGLDIDRYLNWLKEWLGFTKSASRAVSTRITGGVAGLVADIKAILPLTEMRALFNEKLQTSEAFANLVSHLTSDDAIAFFSTVRATEEYQWIIASLEDFGIDFENIRNLIRNFLGW